MPIFNTYFRYLFNDRIVLRTFTWFKHTETFYLTLKFQTVLLEPLLLAHHLGIIKSLGILK